MCKKIILPSTLVHPVGGTLWDGWRTAFSRTEEVYRFPNSVQRVDSHLEWDIDSLFANVKQGVPGSLCKISEYREPFHGHLGGGLCAAEKRPAPLPGLRLPGQPDAGGHPRSPQHSALCATLPAHRHPVPALQQHLSAICRQNSRSAGRSRGLFDDPGISAVETVRRESPRVHQCHLHRPCERPGPGNTTRRFSKLWACRKRCSPS